MQQVLQAQPLLAAQQQHVVLLLLVLLHLSSLLSCL
jgi:hypothetical protein